MGKVGDRETIDNLPSDLGDAAVVLIDNAARLDGAVVLFDDSDNIVWANARQREILPCSSYVGETYEGLFWSAYHAGFLGNAGAREHPTAFLSLAAIERRAEFAQTINEYPRLGRVALTHRRFAGYSLQLRFPIDQVDTSDPEGVLMAAVIATRDAAAMRYALDRVSTGVIIVDGQSRLLYRNAAGEELARQGRLLSGDGILCPPQAAEWASWFSALEAAISGAWAPVILLSGGGGGLHTAVSFGPGKNPGTAILLISPLEARVAPDIGAGLTALGLSRSEASVLQLLAMGRTVEEIARQRDGAEKTVHIHLGNARRKLRVHELAADSHVQLANLVLAIAAITRAHSGAT